MLVNCPTKLSFDDLLLTCRLNNIRMNGNQSHLEQTTDQLFDEEPLNPVENQLFKWLIYPY
jgi:hypothetical protein